jgi:hypothetical protein
MPRASASLTLAASQSTYAWLIWPGAGSPISQVPQMRTQSAPSPCAVEPSGRFWFIVSLTPVSTAEAGAAATAKAAVSVRRKVAAKERMAPY